MIGITAHQPERVNSLLQETPEIRKSDQTKVVGEDSRKNKLPLNWLALLNSRLISKNRNNVIDEQYPLNS